MSGQTIDWAAKAKEYGAIGSTPTVKDSLDKIDWAARAKQYGAVGSTTAAAPVSTPVADSNEFDPARAAANPIGYGYERAVDSIVNFGKNLLSAFGYDTAHYQDAKQQTQGMNPVQEALATTIPHPVEAVKSTATAISHEFQKGSEEGKQSLEAAQRGDIPGVVAHSIGQVGHAGATLTAPVTGELPSKAGEQFGQGDVSGGLGTTAALLAPIAA